MIDSLYAREKKYVYVKQNQRDECLSQSDMIFNLSKCHDLAKGRSDLLGGRNTQAEADPSKVGFLLGVPVAQAPLK
jgi:hypothetical protein